MGVNRDDLLKGHIGHDDSGDSKWEPDVGGYLSDRMQSLITQLERKPLFGFEMHRGAHRVSCWVVSTSVSSARSTVARCVRR
jgi:hypothetical protein